MASSLLSDPASSDHVALLQSSFPFQGYIEQAQHRAITLQQLRQVVAFATENCGRWYDASSESKTYRLELSISFLNLYHLNTWVIKPATLETDCSFVELLSSEVQVPAWFVSHWWGEKICDFLSCISKHAEIRCLDDEVPYWVCAYANRQHSLDKDVSEDPEESSFCKAMQLAQGVVLVLDEKTEESGPATPFSRIWCAFEEYLALKYKKCNEKLFDIAATHSSCAQLLTDGIAAWDFKQPKFIIAATHKAKREAEFPIEVVRKSLTSCLEEAEASVDADRVAILNCIAGRERSLTPALVKHENYSKVNRSLRGLFAAAVWRQAAEKGMIEELCLPQVLSEDVSRELLALDFAACEHLDERSFELLGQGLPRQLQVLRLNFSLNKTVGDAGLAGLAKHLPQDLRMLSLSFVDCSSITDNGMKALASCFPKDLEELRLNFSCTKVCSPGIVCLARCLPKSLQTLSLRITGCQEVDDYAVAALSHHLPAQLLTLELDFTGDDKIANSGVAALAKGFPEQLRTVSLIFTCCYQIGDSGIAAIVQGLPKTLENLHLGFKLCELISDASVAALAKGLSDQLHSWSVDFACTAVSAENMEICADLNALTKLQSTIDDTVAPASPHQYVDDSVPSEEEKQRIKKTFRQYDKSGNGALSFRELFAFLKACNSSMARQEATVIFNEVDKDQDGKICFDEFVDFVFDGNEGKPAAKHGVRLAANPAAKASTHHRRRKR